MRTVKTAQIRGENLIIVPIILAELHSQSIIKHEKLNLSWSVQPLINLELRGGLP